MMVISHPCDMEQWKGDCLQKEILYPFFLPSVPSFKLSVHFILSLSLLKFLFEFKCIPVVNFTHVLTKAQLPI